MQDFANLFIVDEEKEKTSEMTTEKDRATLDDRDKEITDGSTNQEIFSQGSIYFTPSQPPFTSV